MTRRSLAARLVAAAIVSLSATAPLAAQVIDTRNASAFQSYGFHPSSPYLAQTFLAQPSQTSLNNFSFWIGGGANTFTARLYDLTTSSTTPLFTSSTQTGPGGAVQEYTFLTPGVTLTPFSYYMALLTNLGGSDPNLMYVASHTTDTYGGGNAYTSQDGNNFYWLCCADADFRAEFNVTATPEPASIALLATGLIGIGAAGRRRRR